tara:strand:- start:2062 stop:4257 length:2196 start_codon:yes stop_codon:yes gene_type:complete
MVILLSTLGILISVSNSWAPIKINDAISDITIINNNKKYSLKDYIWCTSESLNSITYDKGMYRIPYAFNKENFNNCGEGFEVYSNEVLKYFLDKEERICPVTSNDINDDNLPYFLIRKKNKTYCKEAKINFEKKNIPNILKVNKVNSKKFCKFKNLSNMDICEKSTIGKRVVKKCGGIKKPCKYQLKYNNFTGVSKFVQEAKNRGLACLPNKSFLRNTSLSIQLDVSEMSDNKLCRFAFSLCANNWSSHFNDKMFVIEAQRRKLNCQIIVNESFRIASNSKEKADKVNKNFKAKKNNDIDIATNEFLNDLDKAINKNKTNNLAETTNNSTTISKLEKNPKDRPLKKYSDSEVCYYATKVSTNNSIPGGIKVWSSSNNFVSEANYRGLDCGVKENKTTTVSKPKKIKPLISSAELEQEKQKRIALQKKADEEERKRKKLEKRLAALEKQQKEEKQSKPKTVIAKKPKSEFPLKPIPINFPSVSVKRDDIAVIIGNANYKKQGKDIPNVNPAYADAEGIKQYFMKAKGVREGNIIYLKDATGSQLLSVFGNKKSHKGKLYNYIKPNKSNVYIYYAGHGAPGKEGDAYLVPTDTDSQTIEFTGYPLSTLYSNLGKLPAKSMTVILEACFSGGSQSGSLISRASPIVIQPKKTFIPNNIKVIAAGSERQMASWEEDSSHSLFTKYFLKAMSGEGDSNKDGKVSDNELKDYLSDTMTYYARRYYGRDQKVQIHNGG